MSMSLPPGLSYHGETRRTYGFSLPAMLRAPDWRRHWRIDGPWASTYGAHHGLINPNSPTLDFDLTTATWVDPEDGHGFTAMHTVLLTKMFDDACHLCLSTIFPPKPPAVTMDGRLFCSNACSGLAAELELMQRVADRDYLARSFGAEVDL